MPGKQGSPDYPKGQVRNRMIRHRTENQLVSVVDVVKWRRLTLAALVIVIAGATAWSPASAGVGATRQGSLATISAGDHGPINVRNGNGRRNKSYSAVLSPTITRGVQQVSVTNVNGATNTQNAACKKRQRNCKIIQKLRRSRW